MHAVDSTSGATIDLSRLDPRAIEQAKLDSAALVARNRVILPGAGGAPGFATRWRFELICSEALDPSTITPDTIQMFEIRSNPFTSAPATATPGRMGDIVNHRVPIELSVEQGRDAGGQLEVRIVVTPAQALVDDARYRIRFSGQILGVDFRKTFIGDNGDHRRWRLHRGRQRLRGVLWARLRVRVPRIRRARNRRIPNCAVRAVRRWDPARGGPDRQWR